MRATVAIIMAIVILFVGVTALNTASQSTEDAAMNASNASADAHNLTDETFGQFGDTAAPAVVYGGIAVLVLLSGVVLVRAGYSR